MLFFIDIIPLLDRSIQWSKSIKDGFSSQRKSLLMRSYAAVKSTKQGYNFLLEGNIFSWSGFMTCHHYVAYPNENETGLGGADFHKTMSGVNTMFIYTFTIMDSTKMSLDVLGV